jgi:hypothetical protein
MNVVAITLACCVLTLEGKMAELHEQAEPVGVVESSVTAAENFDIAS